MGRVARVARVAARALLIVVFLAPVAFMVLGSLRTPGGAPGRGLPVVPEGVAAYRELAARIPLGHLLRNSLLVTFVAVPVTVVLASWAGFAIAQLSDRARRRAVAFAVVLLLLPVPVVWVPRFAAYVRLGVLDSFVPLVAPALAATTPFTVLLAYRAFRRVPRDLFDAARLEGAGALTTWWRVGVPLTASTTTAVAALAFAAHWGSYLDALLYVHTPAHRTLPLGVGELAGLDPADFPILLAGAVVLTVPPLAALALVQRRLLGAVDVATDR
ncbi:MAG TPA: ABC transporter permease subunit [Mycobacteriales bacterium]|jgi:multiple sugar transport system permease protein